LDDQTTRASRTTPAAARALPRPNPLATLAPTVAVAAAAVALLPLIAAEQFGGGRRAGDADAAADRPDADANEGSDAVAPASGEAPAGEEGADSPAEPIAIDAGRQNRRNGAKRERNREERGERRSERVAREERPQRRRQAEQPELHPVGAAATAEPVEAEPVAPDAPSAPVVESGSAIGDPPPVGAVETLPSEPAEREAEPVAAADPAASTAQAGPSASEPPSTLQRVVTGRGLLVAPLVDTAVQSPRTVDRLRTQKDAAEKAILNSPDVTAAVAPLVRHVNTITEQLNEAQLTIGRLTAERDALRQRLVEETGVLAEQIDRQVALQIRDGDRRQNRLVRLEGREEALAGEGDGADEPGRVKRYFQRAGLIIPEDAGEEEFKRAARKRQIIAIGIFAAIGLGMWLAQRSGNDVGTISRESFAEIAFLGFFVQIFLALWILYRIVRVGGRGARWLFPQQNTRRRRR